MFAMDFMYPMFVTHFVTASFVYILLEIQSTTFSGFF